jgi:hypothetical protein
MIEVMEEFGLASENAQRLRQMMVDIVGVNGGVELRSMVDVDDAAGGGLAEHAFEVLSRELILLDRKWERPIEQVKAEFEHNNSRLR